MLTYRTLALTAALILTSFPTHGRAEPAQRERGAQRERLAPPAGVTCTGGDQTVYFGRVTAYRRAATYTSLRIRTDYGTTEQVVIRHRRGVSPARWFLLDAEPFKAEDWRRIESRRGQLRPRMRANAWVCSDGSNPVVDWRPTSG